MRELKFRALDKYNCLGSRIGYLTGDIVIVEWDTLKQQIWKRVVNNKDIILMQYTGYKDKNNKEIYEGDIVVRVDRLFGDIIGKVEYHKDRFLIRVKLNNTLSLDDTFPQYCDGDATTEIIGNIHENPELMNNE